MARTTFYVTVEPKFRRTYQDEFVVDSIKVTGVTQSRPKSDRRVGTISAKLTLDIPDGAFLPLRPEAVIVVPEDMVIANLPIQVEATPMEGS